jgi:Protein of unknown function (DUF2798)
MTGKARIIFPLVMAFIMAFIMSGILTCIYRGITPHFLSEWMHSFIIAWPCASIAVFFAIPLAQRITKLIIQLIEKPKQTSL